MKKQSYFMSPEFRKIVFSVALVYMGFNLFQTYKESDEKEKNKEIAKVSIELGEYNPEKINRVLRIQSLENSLVIERVRINRDNCMGLTPNARLNFGQTVDLQYDNSCNIAEVNLKTNKGSRVYSFD